jgi:hypothetical protein
MTTKAHALIDYWTQSVEGNFQLRCSAENGVRYLHTLVRGHLEEDPTLPDVVRNELRAIVDATSAAVTTDSSLVMEVPSWILIAVYRLAVAADLGLREVAREPAARTPTYAAARRTSTELVETLASLLDPDFAIRDYWEGRSPD